MHLSIRISVAPLNASCSPLAFKSVDMFVMKGLEGILNRLYIINGELTEEAITLSY